MPVDVRTETLIERPRAEVAAFAGDPDRARDDASGHTRMTLCNRGEPSGFSRLVAPLMARAMRRTNERDLAKLEQPLEG